MKNIFNFIFCTAVFFAAVLFFSCTTEPTIPSRDLFLVSETTLSFEEPSGIAFSKALHQLWIISGKDQHIYALDTNGIVEKQLSFVGDDLEGITFDEADSTLWVIDEGNKKITQLDLKGKVLFQTQLSYTTTENKGPEGITFGRNHSLLILNEKDPSVLFTLDSAFSISESRELTFASDYSDLFYEYSSDTYFMLSDESEAFFSLNSNFEVMVKYHLPNRYNEGIAYNTQEGLFYIVNDATAKLSLFKIQ